MMSLYLCRFLYLWQNKELLELSAQVDALLVTQTEQLIFLMER